MTIDPRYGVWLSIVTAIGSALVLCGAEFTTLFGAAGSAKVLAMLGLINVAANAANAVLHMIPSQSTPEAAKTFALGPKVAMFFLCLALGALAFAQPTYAQERRGKVPEPPVKVEEVPHLGGIFPGTNTSIATFISNLADISGAISLSTSVPGLQDPVGNACWQQFSGIGALIKAHPLPLNLKAASDLEALRLLNIGLNQVCANPNCSAMFQDAMNAATAISPVPLPISLASICSKIPVITTSAVPTSATPAVLPVGTVGPAPSKP